MTVAIGAPAPQFELYDQDLSLISVESLQGSKALVVFIPFPFTGICDGETCLIRDNLAGLSDLGAGAVIVTTHAVSTNKHWAEENGFDFPVLSDYWPHGEVARAYGTFSEKGGVAYRSTFVLDETGVVRDIVATDSIGTAREFDAYLGALASF
jgi:peroxiredoxin